jgi:hypothetical protein
LLMWGQRLGCPVERSEILLDSEGSDVHSCTFAPCHSERSRSDSDGGVEEPAVRLHHSNSRVARDREGHDVQSCRISWYEETSFSY